VHVATLVVTYNLTHALFTLFLPLEE